MRQTFSHIEISSITSRTDPATAQLLREQAASQTQPIQIDEYIFFFVRNKKNHHTNDIQDRPRGRAGARAGESTGGGVRA